MILEAKGIEKSYGDLKVLHGINFTVADNETFAIIGPNGAGKTTLFKVLTGESVANAGRVLVRGKDVTGMPDFRRARMGFGRTFQVARVFSEMDVYTNVTVAIEAYLSGQDRLSSPWWAWAPTAEVRREVEELLSRFGFARSRWRSEAQYLSHGDRKRLEFCITLATRPRILFLDEPTAGMSPPDRKEITRLLRTLKKETDVAIVMTEHDMDIIFELADRLMVLNYGEIIASGTPDEVRSNPRVRDVYLGQEMSHA